MTKIKSQIKEYIFEQDTVMNNCHASTVLPLDDGSVLAAWFGGSKEGANDVIIYVAKRSGGKWSKLTEVFVTKTLPHWNPVLFLRKNGEVVLYFKYGAKISAWKTYFAVSCDNGESFSKPAELVEGDETGGRGPVKNKNLRLDNGDVLAPASSENPSWKCFIDYSTDDGRSFSRTNFIRRPKLKGLPVDMIQPTLWQSDSGVHAFMRTSKGNIYRSDSEDGRHWCKAYKTPLLNNNSGIDIAKLEDGSLVLISNPIGKNWGNRAPLTLMRSFDDGESFEEFVKLEAIEGDHEFSYPAIVAKGMKLYITYTYERKTIVYAELEIE